MLLFREWPPISFGKTTHPMTHWLLGVIPVAVILQCLLGLFFLRTLLEVTGSIDHSGVALLQLSLQPTDLVKQYLFTCTAKLRESQCFVAALLCCQHSLHLNVMHPVKSFIWITAVHIHKTFFFQSFFEY